MSLAELNQAVKAKDTGMSGPPYISSSQILIIVIYTDVITQSKGWDDGEGELHHDVSSLTGYL